MWFLTCRYFLTEPCLSPAEAKKPPVFDVPLKALTVDEGDKLSLRCHVCGSAPLKVAWMKDRKDLTAAGSTRISFSDGTACLEISAASRHDAGDYLCKATNDAGSEFCKAKVTVKGTGRYLYICDIYSCILIRAYNMSVLLFSVVLIHDNEVIN